jgi:type VI secretion system protein ImpL
VAFLKSQYTMTAVGVLVLSLLVWFGGPYVGFGSYHPWTGVVERVLTMLLFVSVAAFLVLWRQLRAARASTAIAGTLTNQEGAGSKSGAMAGSDSAVLAERFREATDELRRSKTAGATLYDLPWYIVIGPPGTGKTTLIANSGLRFPSSGTETRRSVSGIAGTRNCEWWFTNDAILLDTAGRYTSQDSDKIADREGWFAFLALLKKYRRRRPINGVLVAFSATDLATLSDDALARHGETIRRRLAELHEQFGVALPVYFLITKCDLIAGFSEFFDDLDAEGRRQAWGFTFKIEDSESGAAVADVRRQVGDLRHRLTQRVVERLTAERDLKRRVSVSTFPQEFGSLGSRLESLIRTIFEQGRFDAKMLLRGCYFSSGTQTGTPIDRMMAAVAAAFGISERAPVAQATGARAYFIEQPLKSVVIAESGIAGVNRRFELQKATLQAAAVLACVGIAAVAAVLLTTSYRANLSYVADVAAAADRLPPQRTEATDVPTVIADLDELRALVAVAEQHRGDVPWHMRWGLYRGGRVGETARETYVAAVNARLLPILAAQIREGLVARASDPELLFEYLKGYLMLGDPRRLEPEHLSAVAAVEWRNRYAADTATAGRLSHHLEQLLATGQSLAPTPIDTEIVARVRASLVGLTPARLVYSRIQRIYSADPTRGLNLATEGGIGSEQVFARRSGVSLAMPIAYLYTKAAFDEIATTGAATAAAGFVGDAWVLEDEASARNQAQGLRDQARLPFDVLAAYETDYIAQWEQVLGDIVLRAPADAAGVAETLRILAAPNSPLRALLRVVQQNTELVSAAAAQPGAANPLAQLEAQGSAIAAQATAAAQTVAGAPVVKPGERVTQRFAALRATGPALDQCLSVLTQLQQQLGSTTLANNSPLANLNQGGALDLARTLRSCAASLPAPANGWFRDASTASRGAAVSQTRSQLADRMALQIGSVCRDAAAGRYPFVAAATSEVPSADFARLFAPSGALDAFFQQELAPLVEIRGGDWRWREIGQTNVGLSDAVLASFQHASRIRDAFFAAGSPIPEVRFTLTPVFLHEDVSRVVLEIDGQSFSYGHGRAEPWAGVWPGPTPGLTVIRFEDRSGFGPSEMRQGAWAFFRLLDLAEVTRQTDTRYLLAFNIGGRTTRLQLDAASVRNPFDRAALGLTRFNCPQ